MAGYGDNPSFRVYATGAGYVVPEGTTDAQIAAARQRGALVIDRYEKHFSGVRTAGFSQERSWPRIGAQTNWGQAIPLDEIPAAVVAASYEAAFLELTNPNSLSPVVTGSASVKREKVGQIEVEYAASSSTSLEDLVAMATPVVTTIETLLAPFLMPDIPGALVV